jgi:hypothetical protein
MEGSLPGCGVGATVVGVNVVVADVRVVVVFKVSIRHGGFVVGFWSMEEEKGREEKAERVVFHKKNCGDS